MNNAYLSEKLKELDKEDFIWLIYVGIIFASWYSNIFERKYFIWNDIKAKEKYRKITIGIFAVLIVIYTYFLNDAKKTVEKLNIYDSNQKKELTKLAFIGSLLILISGFIFFYIALKDENIDVEIAFN